MINERWASCTFMLVATFCLCPLLSYAAPPEYKPLQNLGPNDALRPNPGTFDVTPTGEGVWSMPLWTPVGRHGIEPQLSLTYHSRGDNGVLGLGFRVAGLSVITRCWATVAQDGSFATGPEPGLPDKFCLNGQRLIERPNAPQFELQPEFDSSIIVRVGVPHNNPPTFNVYYADGRIERFGVNQFVASTPSNAVLIGPILSVDGTTIPDARGNFTSDSFNENISTTQRRLAWHVDRLEDRYGNFMDVNYERTLDQTGAVELVPKHIRWTGYAPPPGSNAVAAAPSRRLEFFYSAVPKVDVRVGYQAGVAIKRSKLLEKIQIFAKDGLVSDPNQAIRGVTAHTKNDALLREYRFAYKLPSLGLRSTDRLASITECAFASSTAFRCLDPITFDWTQATSVPQFAAPVTLSDTIDFPLDIRLNIPAFAAAIWDLVTGDFDGDGFDDIVYRLPLFVNGRFRDVNGDDAYTPPDSMNPFGSYPAGTVGRGDWFMRRGSSTGLGPRFAVPTLPSTPGGDWKFSPRVLDVDGDGAAELVLYSEPFGPNAPWNASQYQVFRSNCTAVNCSFSPIAPLTERMAFPSVISGSPPRRSFALQTGDLNGDGKVDFIHENATALHVGGDPTTLSFRAGEPGTTPTLLSSTTMRIRNPIPPSNGALGTRLFDERYIVDLDGNGQAELLTLLDDAAPAGYGRPFTFSALSGTSPNGETTTTRTTLHAVDIEASDAIGSRLGHSACRPPADPTLHGILIDPNTGRPIRAYTSLSRYFIDVNGDGLRDSVASPAEPRDRCAGLLASTLFVSLNTGASFRKPFDVPLNVASGFNPTLLGSDTAMQSVDGGVRMADLDGDGREDFLLVSFSRFQHGRPTDLSNRNNVTWLQSTSSGFIAHDLGIPASMDIIVPDETGHGIVYGPRLAQIGDFNGDGLLDFVLPFQDHLRITLQQPRSPDLMIGVSGGPLTPAVSITYAHASVTSPDLYTKNTCNWPQTCLKTLGWVVRSTSIESTDFTATMPTRTVTSYQYTTARMDGLGRGIVGVDQFKRTVSNGEVNPLVFSTETLTFDLATQVCQDTPRRMCAYVHASAPTKSTLEIPIAGGRLYTSQTIASRTLVAQPGGFGYRTVGTTNVSYEFESLPGATRIPLRASRNTTTFDDYGNTVSTVSEVSSEELPIDGSIAPNQLVYRTERSASQPQPLEGPWLISRYRDFRILSVDPTLLAEARITRTLQIEYEPNSVEVKLAITEPTAVLETNTTSGFKLTTTFVRNERGTIDSITEAGSGSQRRVTFGFHANDLDRIFPLSLTYALNQTTLIYSHAALGLVAAVDDPNGVRVSYEYDALGRPLTIRPDGASSTTLSYPKYPGSALGGPRSWSACELNLASGITCNAFDPAGHLVGRQTSGFEQQVITNFTYDRFGRLLTRSLPISAAFGQSSNLTVEYAYDGLGRITSVTRPGITLGSAPVVSGITYDGLKVTNTNERDIATRREFDAKGRLVRQAIVEPGSLREVTTLYEYWHFDLLRKIMHPILPAAQGMTPSPAPLITTMSYDVLGRLESYTDPDGGLSILHHNAFGEAKRLEEANGGITTFAYDDQGRIQLIETVATAAYPSPTGNGFAQRTRWTYDSALNGIGRIALIESNDAIIEEFTYDAAGRMKTKQWTVPQEVAPFKFIYDYNALGQLEYLTYPDTGAQPFRVRYSYADNGQVQDISDVSNPGNTAAIWRQIARNEAGASTEEQFGLTAHVTRRFDRLFNLKHVWGEFLNDGSMFQQLTYVQDWDGLLKSRTDLSPEIASRETYGHDFLDRLDRWQVDQNCVAPVWKYDYDDWGNLRSRSTQPVNAFPSDTFTYTLPGDVTRPHAVKSMTNGTVGVSSFSYDATGLTLSGNGNTYTWSPLGLPWKVETIAGVQQTLQYDGNGTRVVSEIQSPLISQRIITLDGLFERHTFGTPPEVESVYNVFGNDGVVAQVRRNANSLDGSIHFVHRDHLGNPDAITTQTIDAQGRALGSVVQRTKYEPFGERRFPWALAHPLRQLHSQHASEGFTGHEPEDLTGLINMRGRLYNPKLARFISPDLLVAATDSQSFNRYSYVWNSPVNFTDPSGYQAEPTMVQFDAEKIVGDWGTVGDSEEWHPYNPSPSAPPLVQATTDENSSVRFPLLEYNHVSEGPQLYADTRSADRRIHEQRAFQAEYAYRQYLIAKYPGYTPEQSWMHERVERRYEGAPGSYVLDTMGSWGGRRSQATTFGPQRTMVRGAPVDPPRGISPARIPLWTSTQSRTPVENAFGHWDKHRDEFPEFQNAKQYVEGAKDFFNYPPSGTLTKVRPNGDKLFYDPATNTFGVRAANGAPRTMFRPADGINYWNNQQ